MSNKYQFNMQRDRQMPNSMLDEGTFDSQKWELANLTLVKNLSQDQNQDSFLGPNAFSEESNNIASNILPQFMQYCQSTGDISITGAPPSLPPPPQSKKTQGEYEKNITANISKQVVKGFLEPIHRKRVARLCKKHGCDENRVRDYYEMKNNETFGKQHLGSMIIPENESEVGMKRVFTSFMIWYLRRIYVKYMLTQGKMANREKYLDHKTKMLFMVKNLSDELTLKD